MTQGVFLKPGMELKAGSEIFINYGYKQGTARFPSDFPWYFNLKAKVEEERRLELVRNHRNEKDKSKTKKTNTKKDKTRGTKWPRVKTEGF